MGEEVKRVVHAESQLKMFKGSLISQASLSEVIKLILKQPDMLTYTLQLVLLTKKVGVPLIATLVRVNRPTYKITKTEEGYYMMKVDRDVTVYPIYMIENQNLINKFNEIIYYILMKDNFLMNFSITFIRIFRLKKRLEDILRK
jgi:hypothetical protein